MGEGFFIKVTQQPRCCRHCFQLILATKHNKSLHTADEAILVDIDLAVLGSVTTTYGQFEPDIRKEYSTVPGFIFKKKRCQLLQGFLKREYIYHSDQFRESYEQTARHNLKTAIQTLSS